MHWLPTAMACGAPTVTGRGAGQPAGRQILIHSRLHVGIAVTGQDGDPRAFARGVGHDLVSLKQKSKVDDAEHHQQQRRETRTRTRRARRRAHTTTRFGGAAPTPSGSFI